MTVGGHVVTPWQMTAALFSAPVLTAFLVGSLPVLVPVLVFRSLAGEDPD